MALIRVGRDHSFNSDWIAHAEIVGRFYANGSSHSLCIRLHDGMEYHFQHTAGYFDGVDIYKIKEEIDRALESRG